MAKLTTQDVMQDLRGRTKAVAESECNIKTLNTKHYDTKILNIIKTKHYETNVVSPSESVNPLAATPISLGQANESQLEVALGENDSSQCEFSKFEITYLSASLKADTTQRRTLNVDFRTSTTPANKFNKIVFSLSDRRREFFANIPETFKDEWEYQEAYNYFTSSSYDNRWLGKGRPRTRFTKGKMINSKIQTGLTGVLEAVGTSYRVNLWIEGIHKEFELKPTDNQRYPFRFDSGTSMETVEILPRGGWL